MNTLDKAILDLAFKENFNENHMRLQGGKRPWENQQFKDKARSLGVDMTKISNQSYKKNLRKIFLQGSILAFL